MIIMRAKTLLLIVLFLGLAYRCCNCVREYYAERQCDRAKRTDPRHHYATSRRYIIAGAGCDLASLSPRRNRTRSCVLLPLHWKPNPNWLTRRGPVSTVRYCVMHSPRANRSVRGSFVKPGDRDFLQVVLTPGARAIAIPVSTGGASTGLLSPGDRVDVILTQNFKNDNAQDLKNTPLTRRSVSETVVDNLRVLAIDAPDTKPTCVAANPANGNFGRTVTLEVTPDQVEQINVAAELGKLSVALRSVTGPQSGSTTLASAAPFDNTDKVAATRWNTSSQNGRVMCRQPCTVLPSLSQLHSHHHRFRCSMEQVKKVVATTVQGNNIRSETIKPEN